MAATYRPRPGREQARDHENGRSRILTRDSKARGQIFVDRENFVVVIRFDENVADENAADDRAEGELQIGVIAVAEAFPGRSEKCAGACFSRHQRSEHGPPRNAPSAECEVFEIIFLPAHPQADEDDDYEVKEKNAGIDDKAGIHVV